MYPPLHGAEKNPMKHTIPIKWGIFEWSKHGTNIWGCGPFPPWKKRWFPCNGYIIVPGGTIPHLVFSLFMGTLNILKPTSPTQGWFIGLWTYLVAWRLANFLTKAVQWDGIVEPHGVGLNLSWVWCSCGWEKMKYSRTPKTAMRAVFLYWVMFKHTSGFWGHPLFQSKPMVFWKTRRTRAWRLCHPPRRPYQSMFGPPELIV